MRIVKNTPVEESGRFTFEAPLIELVKELKRLNELLETHTVKEPIVDCSWCRSQMPISADTPIVFHLYGCPNKNTPPSNSEKEECCEMVKNGQGFHNLSCHKEEIKEQPTTVKEEKHHEDCLTDDLEDGYHVIKCPQPCQEKEQPTTLEKDSCPYGTQTCRYNGNLCSLCRNEEPTTPETKVKISCPDCPHEETDTPEKKCSDESMVASGYIKTPTGWIAQGEATPAQMVYHVSYEVTCGRCEKSIKHSYGRV